jgi:hypothetical protein
MESTVEVPENVERITNDAGRIRNVSLSDLHGVPATQFRYGQAFRIRFECDLFEDVPDGLFEVSVSSQDGTHVLMATTIDGGKPSMRLGRGRHVVGVVIRNVLLPREYNIDIGIHHADGVTIDYVPRACSLEVLRVGMGSSDHFPWQSVRGYVQASAQWEPGHVKSSE